MPDWRKLPKHLLDNNPGAAQALANLKGAVRLKSESSRKRGTTADKAPMFFTAWALVQKNNPRWPPPEPEYKMLIGEKKWRFDWAWPNFAVAVEVDGGQWAPGGGRHARDSDRDKHNAATAKDWLVFHFSPDQLEAAPAQCVELVIEALKWRETPH